MKLILIILSVGIPSGIENGMFQFGKLAIQSTVSTLGTTAIAAQAMTIILENLNGIAAMGIGIGLMTIVGQCIGAGEKEQAVYYIKKLAVLSEFVVIVCCLLIWALTKPITMIAGMEPASADMCFYMMTVITIVKPIIWVPAFIPPYGLRAAGDVKFSMILSTCSMWIFRVSLCIYLCGCRDLDQSRCGLECLRTGRYVALSLRFDSTDGNGLTTKSFRGVLFRVA